jgi:asparagine synthase (glutamine-hydrolysing)
MCGIAGYFNFDVNDKADSHRLKRMTDAIRHRGPDGEGQYVKENVALGNRRLAVIDLATGDQPMYNDDKSVVLVFNGEVYNYIELRDELKRLGHRFRTSSDTEVVVRAYEQWGVDCQTRLNGMWAFALWDARASRLFCSRDRMGEKPFFYSQSSKGFVFGSEIKALWAYGVIKSLDAEMLDAYLCFAYVPAPYSMFKEIKKLRPGCFLLIENGRVTTAPYWQFRMATEEEARKDERKVIEDFEELFEDSVRIRMRSDVPFGVFLSGVLDSGSVVAMMARHSSSSVNTFTIGFEDARYDERDLARLVAHSFKTNHVERIMGAGDASTMMEKLAWCYDEPFGDSSALPTYVVSKIARERVTMVLTGDGGDEVLSGYTIHQGEKFSQQFQRLPSFMRKSAVPAGVKAMRSIASGTFKDRLQRVERVVQSANVEFVDRLESKQIGFTRLQRSLLVTGVKNVRPAREFIEEAIAPVTKCSNVTKLNHWLTTVSLPDDMLCKVDRASMANSLETRIPFLDYRIVELMAGSSMDIKLKGYARKHVLRESIAKVLPPKLLMARKRGFSVPLHTRLLGNGDSFMEARARECARAGILGKSSVNDIIEGWKQSVEGASNPMWVLAMLSYSL